MTGFMFFGDKIETLGKGLKDKKEACARTFDMVFKISHFYKCVLTYLKINKLFLDNFEGLHA